MPKWEEYLAQIISLAQVLVSQTNMSSNLQTTSGLLLVCTRHGQRKARAATEAGSPCTTADPSKNELKNTGRWPSSRLIFDSIRRLDNNRLPRCNCGHASKKHDTFRGDYCSQQEVCWRIAHGDSKPRQSRQKPRSNS